MSLQMEDLKPGDKLIVEGHVGHWSHYGVRIGDIVTVQNVHNNVAYVEEWDDTKLVIDKECLRDGDVCRWLGEEPLTSLDTIYHVEHLGKTYDNLTKSMVDTIFYNMVESNIQLREVNAENTSLLETIIESVSEDSRKRIVLDSLGIEEVL